MEEQLKAISITTGLQLPEFYTRFMMQHQVADSTLFNNLTLLYGPKDIVSRNLDYEIAKYLPGYLMIGNDGGDYGIVIKANGSADSKIYLCPLGSLAEEDLAIIAYGMEEWASRAYDATEILEESAAIREFHQSETYALRQEYTSLKLALRDIETNKASMPLKDYLLKKRNAQQALSDFETLHEGKRYTI